MPEPLPVLGVHGVGNLQAGMTSHDASARLSGWWLAALNSAGSQVAFDDALRLNVAYYSDHLVRGLGQGAAGITQLSDEEEAEVRLWTSMFEIPEAVAMGKATAPLRSLVAWIARRRGLGEHITERFVSMFFREVHLYLTDPVRRQAARSSVSAAIEATQPRVVIAHSLGSVVAYEALWRDGHQGIDLFLTLGSPLALPGVVLDRLEGTDRGRPPGVKKWIDIADPGDIVAIPRGGVTAAFTGVSASLTDAIGAFEFHRVAAYLACGATQGVIIGLLES